MTQKNGSDGKMEIFDFAVMTTQQVQQVLTENRIALTVDEALILQNSKLQRPPTLTECVLWSIEGSEHCSYKSSRRQLRQLPTDAPHVMLAAKEDAGIVTVATDNKGKRYGLVVSHESHNHPSHVVPYEGAATGVGGNVRDVNCMGAEVIAIADGLRFGDINRHKTRWLHQGVVAGIGGYGNPLGVPTIAGDTYYHSGYNDNCLVTVVTLGIVAEDAIIHSYAPEGADGYDIILVGKPTDNSGFGGASFASGDLDEKQQNKGAVQEPNAFLGQHVIKANNALFKQLKLDGDIDRVGFKDLGAGGIACASVELAEASHYGAEIELDSVPVAMKALHPAVILCSETQERFMWVAAPDITPKILSHYNETFALPQVSPGAQAIVIGKIRNDQRYRVYQHGELVVDALAADVVEGIGYDRPEKLAKRQYQEPAIAELSDYNDTLLALLQHENIASRDAIVETYDKQVQGRTVIEAGLADAGVITPFNSDEFPVEIRHTGVALSLDQNPRYCHIDPYWGTVNAVAEAVRNVASVGAMPLALTDCLCFGNPEKPEQMADFNQAVNALADACQQYALHHYPEAHLPVIAGNVSFYNESQGNAIPASPMISCIGSLADVKRVVTKDLKQHHSVLLLVGERRDECGGSVYYQLHKHYGAQVPKPDIGQLQRQVQALLAVIERGEVLACHDIADGGLAVALAEMSFKNKIGLDVQVASELPADKVLFSETGGFILEVAASSVTFVRALFAEQRVDVVPIGKTTPGIMLKMQHLIELSIDVAYQAWHDGLRQKL